MKNRVAKIVAEQKIEIFEEEVGYLNEGHVLVKLQAVGICGSDLHYFRHGGLGSFKNPFPIHIGHEPSGIVVESKSTLFKEGDRVAIEPGINCNSCNYCKKGLFNLCSNTKFLGANDIGAFRDYISLEPDRLMHIPDYVSYEKAALLEPLGVALHAVDRLKLEFGAHVAVIGSGTIGLCILAVLNKMGCKVTMFDPLDYRLKFALNKLSAHEVVFSHMDLNEYKNSFDGVFDAAGTQDSLDKSVNLVKTAGEICIVGIQEVDYLTINPHKLRLKEASIKTSRRSNQKLEIACDLFGADENVEKMVTHKMPLTFIQDAFDIASNYKYDVIKIMITN